MFMQKVKGTEIKGQGNRGQTHFAPIWEFPDRNSSLSLQMDTKWYTKLEVA